MWHKINFLQSSTSLNSEFQRNAISLVQNLNSCRHVLFLQKNLYINFIIYEKRQIWIKCRPLKVVDFGTLTDKKLDGPVPVCRFYKAFRKVVAQGHMDGSPTETFLCVLKCISPSMFASDY